MLWDHNKSNSQALQLDKLQSSITHWPLPSNITQITDHSAGAPTKQNSTSAISVIVVETYWSKILSRQQQIKFGIFGNSLENTQYVLFYLKCIVYHHAYLFKQINLGASMMTCKSDAGQGGKVAGFGLFKQTC